MAAAAGSNCRRIAASWWAGGLVGWWKGLGDAACNAHSLQYTCTLPAVAAFRLIAEGFTTQQPRGSTRWTARVGRRPLWA